MADCTMESSGVGAILQASVFETTLGWLVLAGYRSASLSASQSSHFSSVRYTVLRLLFGGDTRNEAEARWENEFEAALDSQDSYLADSQESQFEDWYPSCRKKLQEYGSGKTTDFSAIHCDLSSMTAFQQEVLHATRSILSGEVLAYGELARQIRRPKASRAVGAALGRNPVPIIIPCHRIIGANGKLTGFTAPGGIGQKKKMLQIERRLTEREKVN